MLEREKEEEKSSRERKLEATRVVSVFSFIKKTFFLFLRIVGLFGGERERCQIEVS